MSCSRLGSSSSSSHRRPRVDDVSFLFEETGRRGIKLHRRRAGSVDDHIAQLHLLMGPEIREYLCKYPMWLMAAVVKDDGRKSTLLNVVNAGVRVNSAFTRLDCACEAMTLSAQAMRISGLTDNMHIFVVVFFCSVGRVTMAGCL